MRSSFRATGLSRGAQFRPPTGHKERPRHTGRFHPPETSDAYAFSLLVAWRFAPALGKTQSDLAGSKRKRSFSIIRGSKEVQFMLRSPSARRLRALRLNQRRSTWLPGGRAGYSCGTAPDLHRLRLYALASGPEGTSVTNLLCERNGKRQW